MRSPRFPHSNNTCWILLTSGLLYSTLLLAIFILLRTTCLPSRISLCNSVQISSLPLCSSFQVSSVLGPLGSHSSKTHRSIWQSSLSQQPPFHSSLPFVHQSTIIVISPQSLTIIAPQLLHFVALFFISSVYLLSKSPASRFSTLSLFIF